MRCILVVEEPAYIHIQQMVERGSGTSHISFVFPAKQPVSSSTEAQDGGRDAEPQLRFCARGYCGLTMQVLSLHAVECSFFYRGAPRSFSFFEEAGPSTPPSKRTPVSPFFCSLHRHFSTTSQSRPSLSGSSANPTTPACEARQPTRIPIVAP